MRKLLFALPLILTSMSAEAVQFKHAQSQHLYDQFLKNYNLAYLYAAYAVEIDFNHDAIDAALAVSDTPDSIPNTLEFDLPDIDSITTFTSNENEKIIIEAGYDANGSNWNTEQNSTINTLLSNAGINHNVIAHTFIEDGVGVSFTSETNAWTEGHILITQEVLDNEPDWLHNNLELGTYEDVSIQVNGDPDNYNYYYEGPIINIAEENKQYIKFGDGWVVHLDDNKLYFVSDYIIYKMTGYEVNHQYYQNQDFSIYKTTFDDNYNPSTLTSIGNGIYNTTTEIEYTTHSAYDITVEINDHTITENLEITKLSDSVLSKLKQTVNNVAKAAYEVGYKDGYEDGYAAGYADGFADGVASVQAELQ